MNYRRLLVLVAVVGMVALAGCSTGDTTTTAADAPTDTATPEADETADTDTPAGDAGTGSASNGTEAVGEHDGSDTSGERNETEAGEASNGTEAGESDADDSVAVTPLSFSAANVSDAAVEATRDVEQYRAVRNLTTVVDSNNVERSTDRDQVILLNRTGERFQQSATVSTQGRTVDSAAYLVNGTQYSRSQGNARLFGSEWIKIDLGENASRPLDRQDALESARQYLANATLSAAGEATLDGSDVYVVEADLRAANYTAVRSATSPALTNGTTVQDASGTYYVDKDSDRIERVSLRANWTSELGGSTLDQSIEAVTDFEYQSVSVTLPDAAEGAVDIGPDDNETDAGDNETTTSGNETDAEESDDGGETETDETTDSDGDSAADDRSATDGIAVRDGTLAVDPDTTFDRVEFALGTDVTEPDAVTILPDLDRSGNATGFGDLLDRQTFDETVGMERSSLAGRNVSFGSETVRSAWLSGVSVGGYGSINLRSSDAMPTWLVRLLTTHEMVHYAQLQAGWIADANRGTDATTDGRFAATAMVEGGATYLTDEIRDLYAFDGPRNIQLYAGIDALVDPGTATAYGNRQYSDGARYIHDRIDRPAQLSRVYADPPTTSEQVLHNRSAGSEPPAPLTVSVETNGTYTVGATDRKGEAYTRHALANGVDFETASAAAAGWGNDTAVTLRPTDDGNASYLWVHRFDDADNASEFADAARSYLESYGNTTENGTATLDGIPATLRTLDDRTTALVIAPDSLQDGLSLAADGETVTVETP